ncbi:protein HEAT INTOLERANT 4-like [Magnolia sinica]|uniref:protein HEAT INTOLERANT 4-like n=1 Tax=Magnolia sinica TaxID=86752 RepID=UPI0026589CFC|nr:protein HEAT INTOLERANT 4-like [Magnolia sinica]XP_058072505.1 protein HEAT INTOLERANT 4-like [Magnolia sinica]XP_058072506.1 protein HEAT INTOLERANT 4-like [Magnolia sinica]
MVYYKLELRYSRLRGPPIIHEFWMVIMDFIKEEVREAKKAQREARQARKKAVEEMDEETKAAYEKMRFYKFYPVQTLDVRNISQVKPDFHTGAHTWWTN